MEIGKWNVRTWVYLVSYEDVCISIPEMIEMRDETVLYSEMDNGDRHERRFGLILSKDTE